MRHREHDRVMEAIERNVIALLDGKVSKEDLFWMRVDIGMKYLRARYSEEEARRIWRKKSFWRWLRSIWHINDRELLKHLRKGDKVLDLYRDIQMVKINKYRIQRELVRE